MTGHAPHLMGHDAALAEVKTAFAGGRMHHAWLIAGIEGIGKATLAKHIAQFVLAHALQQSDKADSQQKIHALVEAESYPDLLIIRRPIDEKTGEQKNIIPVEQALKVAAFLRLTATHGGWRVVIIDEAHRLNRHGQNAILKIVEEPPPRTLILMTVTTTGLLLPTIRSRARALNLLPLDDAAMRVILQRHAPTLTPPDLNALIDLSGGSIGFALKILRSEALPLYRDMLAILDAMPLKDVARVHKLADQIARKADAESFDVLTALLIERLRLTVRKEAVNDQGHAPLALELWEKTRATLAAAEHGNLDKKLAFINVMADIRGMT